jgi:integrase
MRSHFTAGTLTVKRAVLAIDKSPPLLRDKPKTKSSRRTLEIPLQLVELLRARLIHVKRDMLAWGKDYQRQPLLLFPGLAGAPMNPLQLTERLRTVLRRTGITSAQPVHGWRHTAATSLFDAGHHVKTVQARLGHASPAITLALYTHPVAERDREAAEHFGKLIDRA